LRTSLKITQEEDKSHKELREYLRRNSAQKMRGLQLQSVNHSTFEVTVLSLQHELIKEGHDSIAQG
jgi:hypothetical protein